MLVRFKTTVPNPLHGYPKIQMQIESLQVSSSLLIEVSDRTKIIRQKHFLNSTEKNWEILQKQVYKHTLGLNLGLSIK